MIIDSLTLQGFKSFREAQTLDLGTPGLFFMTGRNLAQPRLGANGAGKSNAWDALTWLFFDRTPRGLRAGDIRSWSAGKEQTRVEARGHLDDGRAFCIYRTWKPNQWRLELDGHSIDLEKRAANAVFAELGDLTLDMWLTAVVTAQECPMFLELPTQAKASMFSALLDLDRWADWGQKADLRASGIDAQMRNLEAQVARLQGTLEGATVTDLYQEADHWEQQREKRRAVLMAEYEQLDVVAADLRDELARLKTRESVLRERLPAVKEATDEADAGRKSCRLERDEIQADLRLAELEYKKAQQALEALHEGADCPTCGQEIGAAARGALQAAKKKAAGNLDDLEQWLAQAEERLSSALAVTERKVTVEDSLRREIDEVGSDIRRAGLDLDRANHDLDRIEDEAEELRQAVNPYAAANAQQAEARRKTEDQLRRVQAQLAGLQEDYELSKYWVRGFKDLRYYQMEEALLALEAEVETALADLGLVGWRLLFGIDKMSKTGKASGRGFTTHVISPESPSTPVPWEAWSGGEAQRLKLATQIGLGELCRQNTGCRLPLEVWDEPTAGLNAQGIQDLLDCLSQRAHRTGRQIWVVDHHSLGYGGFDGSVTVVKDGRGSHFEW